MLIRGGKKDLGEGETPLSDGALSLPKPLLLSPNFTEPNLIHSAYQVARLRGVARGGFLYAGMRFGSAKFLCFRRGFFWYVRLRTRFVGGVRLE